MRNNSLSLFKALPNNDAPAFEPATVLAVGNGTVDVRMADGMVYRHIPLSGGAAAGGTINVQFANGKPQAFGAGAGTSGSGGVVISGSGGGVTGTIIAGSGLTGGGVLGAGTVSLNVGAGDGISVAADSVSVDATVVRTSRTITSGAGLSGGGDLSTDRTLAVGAGTGILANADDVAVNTAYAFNWTNLHTFTRTTEQLRLAYDGSNYTSLATSSGGNLTVAPTGDFLFDPVGNDILPVTNYDLNIGSLQKKYLTLHAAELWVETLVAQDTIATIGGRILVAPTTQLTRDLSNSAGSESTITQRGSATSANGSSSAAGIAFVASSQTYAANTANITVNVPAGTLANHLMIAAVNYWSGVSISIPGGWTQLLTQEITAGGGKMVVYYKIAGASEPSSYTWSLSASEYSMGVIATYSGVDTASPIDVSAIEANTSSTSATQTAITTTVANAMLVYFAAVDDGPGAPTSGLTATPPSGMAERVDIASGWKFNYLADVLQAGAGTTGTKTATLSSAFASATALVALKPASSSTQASVSKPTGTTTGDLLLFTAAIGSATATATIPSGLTLITSSSSTAGVVRWYYKIATASEPSTYTFGLDTTDNLSASCVAYYNVDTSSPIEAFNAVSGRSSASMTATAIASISTTARLIFSGAAIDTTAGSITATPPSGMTELIDAGTGTVRIYLAHVALAASGSTGDKTATLSGAKAFIVGLFALKPIVTGGSGAIYVKHNQMQAGDIVYLQANGRVEWMAITSAPTTVTPGAEYSYTVTRNLDGTGANTWNAGDALANTGTPGSGFIDLYSLESIKGIPLDYIYNYNDTGAAYSANLAQESSWALWDATPANIAANDAIYYGCVSAPFEKLFHYIQTPAIGSGAGVLEYWNGASWATVIGLQISGSFGTQGIVSFSWSASAQTGWAAVGTNGVTAYWVRNRITSASYTTSPAQGSRRVYRDKNTWGPTIAGMVRQSSTFNDIRERWAIGNLNGLYDYGLNSYGAAFGDPLASWLSVDATNGIRIMNGSNKIASWDTAGNITIGDAGSNKAYTYISAGEVQFKSNNNSYFKIDSGGAAVFKQGDSAANGLTWEKTTGDDVANIRAGVDLGYNSADTLKLTTYNTDSGYGRILLTAPASGGSLTFDVDGYLERITASGPLYASSTLNVTGAATFSGNATIDGSITTGVRVPRSSGTALFAMDAANTGSAITLANNATATPFGAASNFSGLLLINETASNGIGAMFMCGGGVTTLIAESLAGYYSITSGTASRCNVYYNGSFHLVIENKQGGSRTFNVLAIRTRASA